MIPDQLRLIPVFVMLTNWHLIGNFSGYILINLVTAVNLFFMRQYFLTIPRDFEEAAKLDGAGYFKTFWRVMLPLAGPAIAALAILQFQGTWNDFFWPLILFGQGSEHLYTMQLGPRPAHLHLPVAVAAAHGREHHGDPADPRHLPRLPALLRLRRHRCGDQGMRPRNAMWLALRDFYAQLLASRRRERRARRGRWYWQSSPRSRCRSRSSSSSRRVRARGRRPLLGDARAHRRISRSRTLSTVCGSTGVRGLELAGARSRPRRPGRCSRSVSTAGPPSGRSPSSRSTSSCCSRSSGSSCGRSRSPRRTGRCGGCRS